MVDTLKETISQTDYCSTVHRYSICSTRYSGMCKVYTGYHGTSEIKHGLCACTVNNPFAKVQGLSLRTGAKKHALYFTYLISLYSKTYVFEDQMTKY